MKAEPDPWARAVTYRGWQPEVTGFLGRTSLAEFLMVGAGLVAVLACVMSGSWLVAAAGLPVGGGLLALGLVRVAGVRAGQWLVAGGRHAVAVASGRNLFASGVFAPLRLRAGSDGPGGPGYEGNAGDLGCSGDGDLCQPMDLPGVLAPLHLRSAFTGSGTEVAVVHDRSANTFSAVLALRYPGLALADVDEQNRRVTGWATLLASLCVEGGPIHRVSVVSRAQPDDGTALAAWTREHTSAGAPAAAVDCLLGLLRDAAPAGSARQTYLCVSVAAHRARAAIRAAGGGPAGASAVLVRELFALQTQLAGAELGVRAWLSPRDLAEVVRTGYDPDAVAPLAARRAAAAARSTTGHPVSGTARHAAGPQDGRTSGGKVGRPTGSRTGRGAGPSLEPGVDPSLAGPAATQTGWSSYRHDGGFSVTYQIRDWPRSAVPATGLHPLLRARSGARRSFALVCEPLGPLRAQRALARDRTRRHVLISLRQRTGRLDSADELADLGRADEQDRARAAGHGLLRFVGLVTVTVTEACQLEAACAQVQADAGAARLELRRLYGAQDCGFAACVLPLGLGLPARRVDL